VKALSKESVISMARYYDLLKELCSCFMTKDLELRAKPKGVWGRREVSENHLEFIRKLMDLELKTLMNSDYTKYYIMVPEATMRDCFEWYKDSGSKEINFNMIRDRISYDKRKVTDVLELKRFDKLFYASSDMSEEIVVLDRLIEKYRDKRDLELGTPLDLSCDREVESLTEEEFNEFVSMIAPFSYGNIGEVSKGIPEKYKGYFNYLNGALVLGEVEKERVKTLGDILDVKVSVKKADVKKEIEPKKKEIPKLVI
jgi:hypothetical protein